MSGFEPGEGWRRLAKGERDQDEMIVHYSDEGSTTWVRVPPMPPLPTEPYTVIRVTWKANPIIKYELVLNDMGDWYFHGTDDHLTPETLTNDITGFEVLAKPWPPDARNYIVRETAKAVLDRIREFYADMNRPWVGYATAEEIVAREFGVEL